MTIEEVLRLTVTALFSSKALRSSVVLKGGTALQLGEHLNNRLSTDVDLSVPQGATIDPDAFRAEFAAQLQRQFETRGFDVIDATIDRRPKKKRVGHPEVWGGWLFTFKLTGIENREETPANSTRRALIPLGAASSRIQVQISEHEYCELATTRRIGRVRGRVYPPTLLIAEKIRAICQQHPDYAFRTNKNRARDFVDIQALWRKHRRDAGFLRQLAEAIEPVFAAKFVPMSLLADGSIFEPSFVSVQEAGFQQVRDTARVKLQPFEFYVEQLKSIIRTILEERARRGIMSDQIAGAN